MECCIRYIVRRDIGFFKVLPITRAITFLAQSSTTRVTSHAFPLAHIASTINFHKGEPSCRLYMDRKHMTPFMRRRKSYMCVRNFRMSHSCGKSKALDLIAIFKSFRLCPFCSILRRDRFDHLTLTFLDSSIFYPFL